MTGKETNIVCGRFGDNFVLIPRPEALRLASVHDAIHSSATWGEFKAKLRPEDWQDILSRLSYPTLAEYREQEGFETDEEASESFGSLPLGERMPIANRQKRPCVSVSLRHSNGLLVPGQEDPKKASDDGRTPKLEWQEIRLQGQDPLAVRASKKLHNDELLITAFAPTRLRLELDRIPLWRGEHVEIKQLTEDFAQYLYLPRLRDTEVLLSAVREGVGLLSWATDAFAYAETLDSSTGRYRGLQAGQLASVHASGLVVKPTKATEQLEAEAAARAAVTGSAGTLTPSGGPSLTGATGLQPGGASKPGVQPSGEQPKKPTRFHGSVELDSGRVGRDAGKIAEEVLQHITALPGANVRVTLEIQAEVPSGIPENVARTVNENCRTLRFTSQGFEEE
jgi:hypothetical protein